MSVALFLLVRGARFTALADFRFIIVFAESPSVLPPARHDSLSALPKHEALRDANLEELAKGNDRRGGI